MSEAPHIPVMLEEVCEHMGLRDGGVYVDGTFGAGGYTRAMLDRADCRVIAFDRDETAIEAAKDWVGEYGDRLTLVHGAFGDIADHLAQIGVAHVDGVVIDIGVSSMQIDQADRGFSFRFDGPLDMRMDTSTGETAAELINSRKEENIANIIYQYGEERLSRRIAKAIINKRPIHTTSELADLVRSCVPRSKKDGIDPATRTFQALRIAVNDELGELERLLKATPDLLADGGALVVVSFHSLEDKIVKNFMRGKVKSVSRHEPIMPHNERSDNAPPLSIVSRKAILPTEEEKKINPRARSARLRAAVKLMSEGDD